MRTQKEGNHAPQTDPLRFARLAAEEQLRQASGFFQVMSTRRTARSFSPEHVPFELIETPAATTAAPFRRQSAALAICRSLKSRGEASDPGSGRSRRKRVLSPARSSRVAWGPSAPREKLAQAVSRDRSVPDCHFSD